MLSDSVIYRNFLQNFYSLVIIKLRERTDFRDLLHLYSSISSEPLFVCMYSILYTISQLLRECSRITDKTHQPEFLNF
jgi:hypothetical protein